MVLQSPLDLRRHSAIVADRWLNLVTGSKVGFTGAECVEDWMFGFVNVKYGFGVHP